MTFLSPNMHSLHIPNSTLTCQAVCAVSVKALWPCT